MADTGFYVKPQQQARLAKAYVAGTSREPLKLLPPMDIPITEKPPLMEGAAGLSKHRARLSEVSSSLAQQGGTPTAHAFYPQKA